MHPKASWTSLIWALCITSVPVSVLAVTSRTRLWLGEISSQQPGRLRWSKRKGWKTYSSHDPQLFHEHFTREVAYARHWARKTSVHGSNQVMERWCSWLSFALSQLLHFGQLLSPSVKQTGEYDVLDSRPYSRVVKAGWLMYCCTNSNLIAWLFSQYRFQTVSTDPAPRMYVYNFWNGGLSSLPILRR